MTNNPSSAHTTVQRTPWYHKIDRFVVAIMLSAVVATLLPAQGWGVPVANWLTKGLIFVLFFLYGARLETREAIAGLKHWRLHSVILAFTYVVFPIIGYALTFLPNTVMSNTMALGALYLTLVPSTVQSSINFTSIAGGNVAGAIVSASTSNLLGVFITPALVLLTMGVTGGITFRTSSILDIMIQILLPFILGQLSRRWSADFVTRNHRWLKYVDQASIIVVVYAAFSEGRRDHIWSLVHPSEIATVTIVMLALLALMLSLTWRVAGWLGFNRKDQIAIQFCGTKKSLATGVPMATVLFANQAVGILVLPLMIFHMVQLIACGSLASRYARENAAETRGSASAADGPDPAQQRRP